MSLTGAPARAVDGVIEINATTAAEGNVTPGDTPFPVQITTSGSYRLTSNLAVPVDATGILITAPGVQLDLNGFTVSSTTTCSATFPDPVVCSPVGTGFGIDASLPEAVSVRNGRVTGFSASGVFLSNSGRAENLQVDNNGVNGISSGTASVVSDCIVRLNGSGTAVAVGPDSRVVGNVVSTNGGQGILAPLSALADRNAVNHNAAASTAGSRFRRFYLSKTKVAGGQATSQCDAGFHMASLWEIYEPALLSYDSARGLNLPPTADAGSGPPSGYDSRGWSSHRLPAVQQRRPRSGELQRLDDVEQLRFGHERVSRRVVGLQHLELLGPSLAGAVRQLRRNPSPGLVRRGLT